MAPTAHRMSKSRAAGRAACFAYCSAAMTTLPRFARESVCTFRFYGPLNDFLPPERRGRRFTHVLRGPASLKDTIEALGVPHPEVDVILVNGAAEDLAHRVRHGDEVSAYPAFRSIDIAGLRRAGSDCPRPVRFAVDAHLGRLASLLRFAGFDAAIVKDKVDLANTVAPDGRVVLTRDVGLLKRNVVRHGYWVRHTDPEAQLAEVLEQFDLAGHMEPFSRCARCNVRVVPVEAEAVAHRVLPRTKACIREFHRCPRCDRIYWRGAHYDQLRRLLERARERAWNPLGRPPGESRASAGGEPWTR